MSPVVMEKKDFVEVAVSVQTVVLTIEKDRYDQLANSGELYQLNGAILKALQARVAEDDILAYHLQEL